MVEHSVGPSVHLQHLKAVLGKVREEITSTMVPPPPPPSPPRGASPRAGLLQWMTAFNRRCGSVARFTTTKLGRAPRGRRRERAVQYENYPKRDFIDIPPPLPANVRIRAVPNDTLLPRRAALPGRSPYPWRPRVRAEGGAPPGTSTPAAGLTLLSPAEPHAGPVVGSRAQPRLPSRLTQRRPVGAPFIPPPTPTPTAGCGPPADPQDVRPRPRPGRG